MPRKSRKKEKVREKVEIAEERAKITQDDCVVNTKSASDAPAEGAGDGAPGGDAADDKGHRRDKARSRDYTWRL